MAIKSDPLATEAFKDLAVGHAMELRLAISRGQFSPEAEWFAARLHSLLDQFLVAHGETSSRKGTSHAGRNTANTY